MTSPWSQYPPAAQSIARQQPPPTATDPTNAVGQTLRNRTSPEQVAAMVARQLRIAPSSMRTRPARTWAIVSSSWSATMERNREGQADTSPV